MCAMADIRAENLTLRLDDAILVEGASAAFQPGTLTAIIGPNGAGKTSLVRMLAGLAKPTSGRAVLDNRDVFSFSGSDRARRIGYLPQEQSVAWPMRVRDVVALGRYAYGASPERLSAADSAAVDAAMTSSGCAHLADRIFPSLSGGEAARVHLARTLAGETPVILADEPISALDPRHQRDTLAVLRDRARAGAVVVIILHDLQLAAHYADRIVWMQSGQIVADGTPAETMTADRLEQVFALTADEVERLVH